MYGSRVKKWLASVCVFWLNIESQRHSSKATYITALERLSADGSENICLEVINVLTEVS